LQSAENLPPVIMRTVARQIKQLIVKPLDGIRYIPDKGSLTEIYAEISGPGEIPAPVVSSCSFLFFVARRTYCLAISSARVA